MFVIRGDTADKFRSSQSEHGLKE